MLAPAFTRTRLAALACIAAATVAAVGPSPGPIAAPPGNREIALRNIHTNDTIRLVYKSNGRYIPSAMRKINWIMRDWRRDHEIAMDPALIDLLWEIHTELGSRAPINIISGYRSPATNAMLRNTRGGQAKRSQHMLGKAADVQFPDIPVRQLRYSALIRERGGVGYYPTSATPFVHVDTGRVRAWPRLPRHELALLFPNARTRHLPASGGPLKRDDITEARRLKPKLHRTITAFHQMRRTGRPTVLVAQNPWTATRQPPARTRVAILTPPPPAPKPAPLPPPKLVMEPRLVDRPTRLETRPSTGERNQLAQLSAMAAIPPLLFAPRPAPPPPSANASRLPASLGRAPSAHMQTLEAALTGAPRPGVISGPPLSDQAGDGRTGPERPTLLLASISEALARFGSASGWSIAPAFDEEHPEEISYRPFPIGPYLTETASPDDPALTTLTHPDNAQILAQMDEDGAWPPMRLRPGRQVAQLLWAQRFEGTAVAIAEAADAETNPAPGALTSRTVRVAADR